MYQGIERMIRSLDFSSYSKIQSRLKNSLLDRYYKPPKNSWTVVWSKSSDNDYNNRYHANAMRCLETRGWAIFIYR